MQITPADIFNFRKKHGIMPVYKTVDTCAAEFESETSNAIADKTENNFL